MSAIQSPAEERAQQAQIWDMLEQVSDPEIPVISLIDLGVVREVRRGDQGWEVVITPTYSGCPAMTQMADDIVAVTAAAGMPVQVRTALGRATVLGSLAEVEAALPDAGLRVHRSHWIAFAHLRRVSKSAKGWACELRGGERVPISRRRLAEVRERLGSGFVIDPMG